MRTLSNDTSKGLLPGVTLILTCLPAALASAEEGIPLSEHYFFEEVPIVLSATRLSQKLSDVPAAITIIDKQMIKASGALEIPDLLRLVPGFHVARYIGSKQSATYHGLADEYARDMQVLVDGRSVYDPVFGGVSWTDLPLTMEEINRIEVIRGPNASAYGSNSFAGVINIITEHPSQQQGTQFKVTGGSEETRKTMLRHSSSIGKLDYRLSFNYKANDGFDGRHDSSEFGSLGLRSDYQLGTHDTILFKLGYSKGTFEDGFPGAEIVQPEREIDNLYHYQQVRWTHTLNPANEISLQFYHNYQDSDDVYVETLPAPFPPLLYTSGFGFESHRYDLEFEHTWSLSDSFRLVWGLGARHDRGDSYETMNNDSDIIRFQGRGFINSEWRPIQDLVVNAGLMYEDFDGHDGLFSPRLALNYQLAENHTLRFAASRAYRVPTLLEANADQIIRQVGGPLQEQYYITTTDLDPMEIKAFEIGYLGVFPAIHSTMDVKIFHERIEPLISSPEDFSAPGPNFPGTDPGAFRYLNSGQVDISGAELQFTFRPSDRTIVFLGYGAASMVGEEARQISVGGTFLSPRNLRDKMAHHTASLLASHRFANGLQLSVDGYYLDSVTWKGEGDPLPDYRRWDLRLSKDFRFPDVDGEIALILQNVNGSHLEFRDDNKEDEGAYLQMELNFK
jgi:iron complex outermembrane receptor protein